MIRELCIAASAALLGASVLVGSSVNAATICVSPTAAGCEITIQDAVDGATGADTIVIEKGRYDENIVIPSGLDGLTIEGKGAVLDADLPNTGTGLTIGSSSVTVRGLALQNGLQDGIAVTPDTVSGVTLSKISVKSASAACITLEGNGHTVESSVVEGCGGIGITADGDDFVATGNKLARIGSTAMVVTGARASIEKNKLSLLKTIAMRVEGDDARVIGNSFNGVSSTAIEIDGNDFVITGNKGKIIDRSIVRASCGTCTGGLISGNRNGASTSDEGISAQSAGGLIIENNVITRADNGGIVFHGDGAIIRDNTVSESGSDAGCYEINGNNNTIERNVGSDCMKGGFLISGDGAVLTDNVASNTLEDGFDLESGDGATLTGNRAIDNLGVGFAVSQGVTGATLQENSASGNRDDYCDAGTGTVTASNIFDTTLDPMGLECPVDK